MFWRLYKCSIYKTPNIRIITEPIIQNSVFSSVCKYVSDVISCPLDCSCYPEWSRIGTEGPVYVIRNCHMKWKGSKYQTNRRAIAKGQAEVALLEPGNKFHCIQCNELEKIVNSLQGAFLCNHYVSQNHSLWKF